MSRDMTCPVCGAQGLDVCTFDSMMVLSTDLALFSLECPFCAAQVSNIYPIPPMLYEEVRLCAQEVGAGMGRN